MRVARAAEVSVVLVAVAAALIPLPHPVVERWFSVRIYPRIQHVLTPLSNLIPLALFDLLVVCAVAGAVATLVAAWRRGRRERRWQPALEVVWRLGVGAAAVYLLFLLSWGFNYQRLRMGERLILDRGQPGADAVRQLGMQAAARLNALHAPAHTRGWARAEWQDAHLRAAFVAAQRLLSDAQPAIPGRLKRTLFGPYFRWTGVDGMVDPFALEVLVNPDLLPWERPFVAAHEWSHLAGYADESEANFVGWLTCLRGDEAAQYSGWLYVFWEVSGEVAERDRRAIFDSLEAGPRRDVTAIIERLRRGQLPLLRNASWMVYDQYLRANRVEGGIRSYGEVVNLILRARFDDGYRPVRRAPAGSSR